MKTLRVPSSHHMLLRLWLLHLPIYQNRSREYQEAANWLTLVVFIVFQLCSKSASVSPKMIRVNYLCQNCEIFFFFPYWFLAWRVQKRLGRSHCLKCSLLLSACPSGIIHIWKQICRPAEPRIWGSRNTNSPSSLLRAMISRLITTYIVWFLNLGVQLTENTTPYNCFSSMVYPLFSRMVLFLNRLSFPNQCLCCVCIPLSV